MTARFDWPGLLRAGLAPVALGGAGLQPAQFWALSPAELALMLGRDGGGARPLGMTGLAALMAAYPDSPARGGVARESETLQQEQDHAGCRDTD